MKKFLIAIIGLNLLIVGWVVAKTDASQLQNQLIKIKCSAIKIQVDKTKLNDSLVRVNYGQMYESTIIKLMVPVNTRLIANRYNKTSALVEKSDLFEQKVELFKRQYQTYQEEIDQLSQMDCQKSTAKYYQQLVLVRQSRAKLKQSVAELEKLLVDYKSKYQEIIDEQVK